VHLLGSEPPGGAAREAEAAGWEVRALDYWTMTVKVIATLPADATNATIDVATIPGNFEIARTGVRYQ
jgi:hypothetical protein